MRVFTIALLGIAILSGLMIAHSAAPTQFTVNGSTVHEQMRIARIESTLNFAQEAMPASWEVTIWSQGRFEKFVRDTNTPTNIAFTYIGDLNHTYINEYFLVWASDAQVQYVLAHEAGHMICECKSENKADEIARVLMGHSIPYLER